MRHPAGVDREGPARRVLDRGPAEKQRGRSSGAAPTRRSMPVSPSLLPERVKKMPHGLEECPSRFRCSGCVRSCHYVFRNYTQQFRHVVRCPRYRCLTSSHSRSPSQPCPGPPRGPESAEPGFPGKWGQPKRLTPDDVLKERLPPVFLRLGNSSLMVSRAYYQGSGASRHPLGWCHHLRCVARSQSAASPYLQPILSY